MYYGQIMGYPRLMWITWVLFAFSVWCLVTTIWIIRSNYREQKLQQKFNELSNKIKTIQTNVEKQEIFIKSRSGQEGLTSKQKSQIRIQLESKGTSKTRKTRKTGK